MLDKLVLCNGFAKGMAFFRIADGLFQTGFDDAHSSCRHSVTGVIQGAHGNLEAFPLFPQAVADRNPHVEHADPSGVAGPDSHLALNGASAQALPAAFQNKGADPSRSFAGIRLGKDQEAVSDIGQCDPHLLAIEDVIVPVLSGGALKPCHVRAGVGFS